MQCGQDTAITGFHAQFVAPMQTQVKKYPPPFHVHANATLPWVDSYALNAIPLQVDGYEHQIVPQPWVDSYAMQANAVHPQANALPLQVDSDARANAITPPVKSYTNVPQHPFTIHQQVHTQSIISQSDFPAYIQPLIH